jgi:hypothetical protein
VDKDGEDDVKIPSAKMIQVQVYDNFLNGKDCHVRQVHLYGPKKHKFSIGGDIFCQSPEFQRWLFPR